MLVATQLPLVRGIALDTALFAVATLAYAATSFLIRKDTSSVQRLFEFTISLVFGYSVSRVLVQVALSHLQKFAVAVGALPGGWTISNETTLHTLVTIGTIVHIVVPAFLFIVFRLFDFDIRIVLFAAVGVVSWACRLLTSDDQDSSGIEYRFKKATRKLGVRVLVYTVVILSSVVSGAISLPQGQFLKFSTLVSLLASSSPILVLAIPVAVFLTDIAIE